MKSISIKDLIQRAINEIVSDISQYFLEKNYNVIDTNKEDFEKNILVCLKEKLNILSENNLNITSKLNKEEKKDIEKIKTNYFQNINNYGVAKLFKGLTFYIVFKKMDLLNQDPTINFDFKFNKKKINDILDNQSNSDFGQYMLNLVKREIVDKNKEINIVKTHINTIKNNQENSFKTKSTLLEISQELKLLGFDIYMNSVYEDGIIKVKTKLGYNSDKDTKMKTTNVYQSNISLKEENLNKFYKNFQNKLIETIDYIFLENEWLFNESEEFKNNFKFILNNLINFKDYKKDVVDTGIIFQYNAIETLKNYKVFKRYKTIRFLKTFRKQIENIIIEFREKLTKCNNCGSIEMMEGLINGLCKDCSRLNSLKKYLESETRYSNLSKNLLGKLKEKGSDSIIKINKRKDIIKNIVNYKENSSFIFGEKLDQSLGVEIAVSEYDNSIVGEKNSFVDYSPIMFLIQSNDFYLGVNLIDLLNTITYYIKKNKDIFDVVMTDKNYNDIKTFYQNKPSTLNNFTEKEMSYKISQDPNYNSQIILKMMKKDIDVPKISNIKIHDIILISELINEKIFNF